MSILRPLVTLLAAALFAAPGFAAEKKNADAATVPTAPPPDANVFPAPPNTATALAQTTVPDLAYGAFQRGEFLTAFDYATKRVTDKSDPVAMTLLGELYAQGLGIKQDYGKAAEWYRLAAARGDRNAIFALAMLKLQGRAGPRDRDGSAKLLAQAAKLGHPLAAYDLALLYIEGQLFPQDFAHAAALLRIAVEGGSAEAQYALGTLYKQGRGVKEDQAEAARLIGLAALADNVEAQVEYAIMLYNGTGVPRDIEGATQLFHHAALKGNPVAQDRLARIYASGRGAKADPAEAVKWHLISRAAGETNIDLDAFMVNLDIPARAKGEAEAKKWLDFATGKSEAASETK